jgi:hypothetical protein
MAMGWNDAVIGSITVGILLIVLGMVLLVGAILWLSRAGKVRDVGRVMVVFALAGLVIMVIAMAVKPAEVIIPPDEEPGTFDVLSVTNVTGATYIESSKTFTVAATVNATARTMTPTYFLAVFNVQRTDSGTTTDIKTVTSHVTQTQVTDPVTGLTYNTVKPTSYGEPDCDWLMSPGSVTASNTLNAQLGLTPYESGTFQVNITWNPSAFTTSNVAVNDVIYAGSITVGGEVYQLQVLLDVVNT